MNILDDFTRTRAIEARRVFDFFLLAVSRTEAFSPQLHGSWCDCITGDNPLPSASSRLGIMDCQPRAFTEWLCNPRRRFLRASSSAIQPLDDRASSNPLTSRPPVFARMFQQIMVPTYDEVPSDTLLRGATVFAPQEAPFIRAEEQTVFGHRPGLMAAESRAGQQAQANCDSQQPYPPCAELNGTPRDQWGYFPLDQVPESVLPHVFSHLSVHDVLRVSLVCKSFNSASQMASIWNDKLPLSTNPFSPCFFSVEQLSTGHSSAMFHRGILVGCAGGFSSLPSFTSHCLGPPDNCRGTQVNEVFKEPLCKLSGVSPGTLFFHVSCCCAQAQTKYLVQLGRERQAQWSQKRRPGGSSGSLLPDPSNFLRRTGIVCQLMIVTTRATAIFCRLGDKYVILG